MLRPRSERPPVLLLCAQVAALVAARRLGAAGIAVGLLDEVGAREPAAFASRYPRWRFRLAPGGGEGAWLAGLKRAAAVMRDTGGARPVRGILSPALMHAQDLRPDERIHASLGEVLSGERSGREGDERIHLAHVGLGLDDVAPADAICRCACATGLGQRLQLWDQPLWA